LQDAVDLEKGKHIRGIMVSAIVITPVRKRSPSQMKSLRSKLGMTQAFLADVLGVTKKAVEAWEAGTKNPSGPVLRMLEILEKETSVLQRVGIDKRKSA
jgi:putative transcriptional regulator